MWRPHLKAARNGAAALAGAASMLLDIINMCTARLRPPGWWAVCSQSAGGVRGLAAALQPWFMTAEWCRNRPIAAQVFQHAASPQACAWQWLQGCRCHRTLDRTLGIPKFQQQHPTGGNSKVLAAKLEQTSPAAAQLILSRIHCTSRSPQLRQSTPSGRQPRPSHRPPSPGRPTPQQQL